MRSRSTFSAAACLLAALAVTTGAQAQPEIHSEQNMRAPVGTSKAHVPVQFMDSGRFGDLPFSDAVRVGNVTYFSGEIGYDTASKKLVPGGIRAETWQIMNNLKASVEANGYRMQDIVKCTAMLADMAEWPAFNEIYRSYFSKPYPARSAFGANGLALGARVELECIAAR